MLRKVVSLILALTLLCSAAAALADTQTYQMLEDIDDFDIVIEIPEGALYAQQSQQDWYCLNIWYTDPAMPLFDINVSFSEEVDEKYLGDFTQEEKDHLISLIDEAYSQPVHEFFVTPSGNTILFTRETDPEAGGYAAMVTVYQGFFFSLYCSHNDYAPLTDADIQLMHEIIEGAWIYPSDQTAPNPVWSITPADMLEQTGVSFVIPAGAQGEDYSIINMVGEANISQVQFLLNGIQFCCRMQPSDSRRDNSGAYYKWSIENTVALPGAEALVLYNEGGAGIILWYSEALGLASSVTMNAGASEAALVAVAEPLAAWQVQGAQDGGMAIAYDIREDSLLTVTLDANATTGYAWTYEISDPEMLACQSEEYTPYVTDAEIAGSGGTYVATFAPTMKGAGKVTLTFRYAREWEPEPVKTYVFDLWITEAGTLSVEGLE